MTHFLITYDRETQDPAITEFSDGMEAFEAFSRRERELLADDRYEVVLLAAESVEELRVTHPNFFAHGDLLPA